MYSYLWPDENTLIDSHNLILKLHMFQSEHSFSTLSSSYYVVQTSILVDVNRSATRMKIEKEFKKQL